MLTLSLSMLLAQTATTSLRGVVTDAKGAVLPSATVTINDPQNGLSRTVKTNGQGEYQFLQLPPSTYTVSANALGFATVRQEKMQLLVAVPSTLNFTMRC